ncbi:unnamed protein product [Acanthoscelides obtectus]|uniref:Uncharacterized protein n=1 Tax=Acanthoscelides obtectus TaxID=200917 RepID=A0A9P0K180_ACAOB|nr:unnamed protein product [Acanthoscelides obtectus]CAK1625266.1 hypothetical protein AOBTE_LOCUS3069 [Acanthoscelides obtectus]
MSIIVQGVMFHSRDTHCPTWKLCISEATCGKTCVLVQCVENYNNNNSQQYLRNFTSRSNTPSLQVCTCRGIIILVNWPVGKTMKVKT